MKGVHQVERLLWRKKIASKYVNLLSNLVVFCIVAMLAAILKASLQLCRCSRSQADIVGGKLCQNTRIQFFISVVFFYAN